jgi:hypothetical protein
MLILGEQIPLKDNLLKSFREHQLLWAVLLITIAFDFATTLLFMSQYGIRFEKNLVVRWLANTLGIIPGVLIGKSLQLLPAAGFCALSFRLSRPILLLIVLLNFFAILVNLF